MSGRTLGDRRTLFLASDCSLAPRRTAVLSLAAALFLASGVVSFLAPPAAAGAEEATITDKEAVAYVGRTVAVTGVIANVFTSRAGNSFLNFGRPHPDQTLSAVIFRDAAARFGDPAKWEGKKVVVRGRIKLYNGRPEIILDQPSQISLAP